MQASHFTDGDAEALRETTTSLRAHMQSELVCGLDQITVPAFSPRLWL